MHSDNFSVIFSRPQLDAATLEHLQKRIDTERHGRDRTLATGQRQSHDHQLIDKSAYYNPRAAADRSQSPLATLQPPSSVALILVARSQPREPACCATS